MRTSVAATLLAQSAIRAKEVLIEEASVESRVASLRQEAAVNVTIADNTVVERQLEVDQHRRDELAATIAVQTVATAHAADLREALLPQEIAEPPAPPEPFDPAA